MNQKTAAKFLDDAAARSKFPATGKQCWFLAKLILEKSPDDMDEYIVNSNSRLSKTEASELINFFLKH